MNIRIHPQALCETTSIGAGTRVWAFAHVLPGARIGRDCNICDHVFIENDVVVGDRVTIKCGVQLWDGVRLADDVFVGPNAAFTNDLFPRSKQYPEKVLETHVGPGASIGANATILPGLRIGASAMIGAGAVVTRDVPAKAIVVGNPARIVGYADTPLRIADMGTTDAHLPSANQGKTQSAVTGVTLHSMPLIHDIRGNLSVGQFGHAADIPFIPKRYFFVFDVPGKHVRGEHAHYECEQFLVCIKGSVSAIVDDGSTRQEILLDRPNIGLYVPPLIWGTQYRYSEDAVLLVFASHPYDAADYIREYDEFLTATRRRKAA